MPIQLNFFNCMIDKAKQFIKKKDYDQAEQIHKQLEKAYKHKWELEYEQIRLQRKRSSNYQKALIEYRKLSEKHSEIGIIYYQIAKCLIQTENQEEAQLIIQLACQLDSTNKYNDKLKLLIKTKIQDQPKKQQSQETLLINSCEFENLLIINSELDIFDIISNIWLHNYQIAQNQIISFLKQIKECDAKQCYQCYLCQVNFILREYQLAQQFLKVDQNYYSFNRLLDSQIQICIQGECYSNEIIQKILINDILLDDGYCINNQIEFYIESILLVFIKLKDLFEYHGVLEACYIYMMKKLNQIDLSQNDNYRFRLVLFQFQMNFDENVDFKQKELEIDDIIKHTRQFAYGYQLKFELLVLNDRRDQAKQLQEQVEFCNDNFYKFILLTKILILKQDFNQAFFYLNKAELIDKFDPEIDNLKIELYQKTNQIEFRKQLNDVQLRGTCIFRHKALKQYLWEYLFQFQYFKALSLIKCQQQCEQSIFFINCIQILNKSYNGNKVIFNASQIIQEINQINLQSLNETSTLQTIQFYYQQIMNNQQININLELHQFKLPRKSYQNEFLCNQLLFQKEYLDDNQVKNNINLRYCQTIIDLFQMILQHFINEQIITENFINNSHIKEIDIDNIQLITTTIVDLTYNIYNKFQPINQQNFIKNIANGLNIIVKKGQTPDWVESMNKQFKNIEKDIITRIENNDYDFIQYSQQLQQIYQQPYFYDGISKLALTDIIKLMGFASNYSDIFEQQSFEIIMLDQFAHRKYEQFYKYIQKI